MKKVLVIGSSCVDIILKVDYLPAQGEYIEPEYQKFLVGGCAHNVAHVIKSCGAEVCFLTPVGQGVYGDYVWKHMEKKGFRGPIRIQDMENGCCYCLVDCTGERTFLSIHGAEYSFHESYMKEFENEDFDYTYVCGLEIEEETGPELIDYLKKRRTTIFYAPSSRITEIPIKRHEALLELGPILHLNEEEAVYLAGIISRKGIHNIETAGKILNRRTGNLVIITMGEEGSVWIDETGKAHYLEAEQTKVKDTIGAGDSHAGGVLSGLALGKTVEESMALAGRIAAAVVEIEGAQASEEEIRARL